MARFQSLLPGSANVRDLGLAAFAAGGIAFAVLAMPDWRLTAVVDATGIAAIFPPAQPPLGNTARLTLALGLGAVFFAAFAWLLRAADRVSSRPAAVDADKRPAPIRLRRADAHPDAPPRRPLAANRDLGEPGEVLVLSVPAEPEPEPELVPELVLAPEPEPEPEPVAVTAPVDEPGGEFVPERPAPPIQVTVVEEAPAAPAREESISELMQRLESGLGRRETAAAEAEAPPPLPGGDAVGHRLRGAIADLQKLAARA